MNIYIYSMENNSFELTKKVVNTLKKRNGSELKNILKDKDKKDWPNGHIIPFIVRDYLEKGIIYEKIDFLLNSFIFMSNKHDWNKSMDAKINSLIKYVYVLKLSYIVREMNNNNMQEKILSTFNSIKKDYPKGKKYLNGLNQYALSSLRCSSRMSKFKKMINRYSSSFIKQLKIEGLATVTDIISILYPDSSPELF